MHFNANKTEDVIFSNKTYVYTHVPLQLGNVNIDRKMEYKHIGMVLDSKPNFQSLVREVIVKARRRIGIIRYVSKYVCNELGWEDLYYRKWYRCLCQFYSCYFFAEILNEHEQFYNLRYTHVYEQYVGRTISFLHTYFQNALYEWNTVMLPSNAPFLLTPPQINAPILSFFFNKHPLLLNAPFE